jgi:hypothetical protein
MKRYKYTGSFNFSYSKNIAGDNIENRQAANDFRLTWSHSPQSTGTGRFSASVNAATATFNKNNNLMFGATNELSSNMLTQISTKLSSNVSYNKRFAGTPFSMGLNLSHNQDLQTRLVDLPLPNLTVNMTNLYPFQRKGQTSTLDNFSIGYSMTATNRITNNIGRVGNRTTDSIAAFTLDNLPLFLKNARNGVRHNIPLSYSFKALRFFTVSPSVSYEEKWYFEKLQWDSKGEKVIDTVNQFNAIRNYSLSAGMTTRLYGMYIFTNPKSKVKAIRHVINPSVSYNYTPDFSGDLNYFQPVYGPDPRDTTRTIVKSYRSLHEGFVYGASSTGKSQAISFGIGNNLEMKVRGAKDTVDRKVMLLNNFSISSSYNMVADSFKLAPFGIAANTSILDNLININLSATLDPYYYKPIGPTANAEVLERKDDAYAWRHGKIGRITNANLALNTNLNPQMRDKQQTTREKVAQADIPEEDKQHIIQNPNAYIDFDIPWSVNLSYSLNYTHSVARKPVVVQTLTAGGDLSISEKWKITYNTGYDFKMKEFTQTNLGISRDLHCWQMNLTWIPFGRFTSYNFTIAVKASVLQDLKLERRKPFLDNL